MINKIVACCLFLFSSFYATGQSGKNSVVLTGKLVNFSNQEEVQDLSEMQYLLPATNERIIIPDADGRFRISFKVDSPNYFRLGRIILYLSPGDSLAVVIDKNRSYDGTFEGIGAEANRYLRNTPFPKGGSFLEAGRNVKKIARATIDTVLRIAEHKSAELKAAGIADQEFIRLEQARIKADLINSLRAGRTSYRPRISADSLAVYTREYDSLVQPLIAKYARNFIDTSFLKIVVYRDIAGELIRHNAGHSMIQHFQELQQAEKLVREMKSQSDKTVLQGYSKKINNFSVNGYRQALQQTLQQMLKFGKGDMAVDFNAIDLKGNPVSLSSLKGKVIYIDLWATWCGPCLAEMPQFEKIKERFASNSEVAIISLSIDDSIEGWKKNVQARKADGIQWQINRNALNDYDIVTIPRTIIIDKDFSIVELSGPLPSSTEAGELIERLLK